MLKKSSIANKNNVIVVGGGLGGLATAALLAKDGFNVTVLEKNAQIGGRARVIKEKGFIFDMGPSWYMMPDAFERYFAIFGKKPSDFYNLVNIDPHYKVFFENGNTYKIGPDLKENINLFEKTEKGSGKKLTSFLLSSATLYKKAMESLIYLDYNPITQLVDKKIILNLPKLNLFKTFHQEVASFFKNEELQKILEFTTVFLGGSPYNTPAFYTLIAHTDFNLKIWHPIGGMGKVVEALKKLCDQYKVKIITNETVIKIEVVGGVAKKVVTEKNTYLADFFVCGADYAFCETQLLEPKFQTHKKNYWEKRTLSPSAFLIYLGLNKKLKNMAHHNLYFDTSWENHFKAVYNKKQWPEKPSYYVHNPTFTDPSLAPKGCDLLIFLVPVAAGLLDSEKVRDNFCKKTLKHFETITGQNFTKNIVYKKIFSHKDFIDSYNSYKGTAFGIAHTLTQTAVFRPNNKSKKVKNLYYVGQYTNPGIGVPMCLISSQITSKLLLKNARKN